MIQYPQQSHRTSADNQTLPAEIYAVKLTPFIFN